MARYRVNYVTTASASLIVEADSEVEATDLADGEGIPDVCAHCAGLGRGRPGIELGEWLPDPAYPVEVIEDR